MCLSKDMFCSEASSQVGPPEVSQSDPPRVEAPEASVEASMEAWRKMPKAASKGRWDVIEDDGRWLKMLKEMWVSKMFDNNEDWEEYLV